MVQMQPRGLGSSPALSCSYLAALPSVSPDPRGLIFKTGFNSYLFRWIWGLSACVGGIPPNRLLNIVLGFPGGSVSKELPVAQETLGKGMVPHSSIIAWGIPWTEEPGGLQSMRSQRVRHDWSMHTHTYQQLILCALPIGTSQVALEVKNLPANAGDVRDVGSILGWEDPPEEGMATLSSVLARRIL